MLYAILRCLELNSENPQRLEDSRCYFIENWLMKHKWATLVSMQPEIYHQNFHSFYPSETFTFHHITMRHPVYSHKSNVCSKAKELNRPFSIFLSISTMYIHRNSIVSVYSRVSYYVY